MPQYYNPNQNRGNHKKHHHNNHRGGNYDNHQKNSLDLHFNGFNLNIDIDKFGGYVKSKVREKYGTELSSDMLLENVTSSLLPDFGESIESSTRSFFDDEEDED